MPRCEGGDDEKATPTTIENGRPYFQTFSIRMTTASAAITAMFMAPTAISTIISPQQHADAVRAVVDAHTKIPSRTAEARVVEQRSDRRAAVAEAHLLQRRQLIDARDGEDRRARPTSPRPATQSTRRPVRRRTPRMPSNAEARPDDQVPGQELRHAVDAFPRASRGPTPSGSQTIDHRRDGGNIIAAIITTHRARNARSVRPMVPGPMPIPLAWSTVTIQASAASAHKPDPPRQELPQRQAERRRVRRVRVSPRT